MTKYAIIGDLHVGQTNNSMGIEKNKVNQIFYNTLLNYGEWIKSICAEKNISKLIFLGDIFDSRNSITLESIHYATKFFDLFEKYQIDIILGNHCCYFNDSTEIHSLAPFKNHPNITIHEKPVDRDGLVFVPWATKLEDIPHGKYNFGHYDIVGYELTKGKISNHGFKGVDLMRKAKKAVFSGHYHLYQKRIYDGKPLIYTGSAYGLSFNDADSPKYLHILDTSTGEIERIENTVSPKFKYVRSESDLIDIKRNFISVISDDPVLIEKAGMAQPLSIRKELIDEFKKIEQKQEEVKEFKVVDIPEAIEEFSLNLPDEWKLDDDLKKEVAKRTTDMYNTLK